MPGKLVRTRLGKDLDPSIANPVELRRKRILIDADLANRRLRRKLPSLETININLTPVRSGSRSSQRLQLILQLVRVIRQRIEVASVQHNRAPVLIRIHTDAIVPVRYANVLLLHSNGNGNIQLTRLSRRNRNIRLRQTSKPVHIDRQSVDPRGNLAKAVDPILTRFGREDILTLRQCEGSPRHNRFTRVEHLPTQSADALRKSGKRTRNKNHQQEDIAM